MRYLVLFSVMASLLTASASDEVFPKKLKPVITWIGTDSKQAKASFSRCSSQEEWAAVWHKHQGRDEKTDKVECPEIDFASYMVVAICYGKSEWDNDIGITAVSEERDAIRVRYCLITYQTGFVAGQIEETKEEKIAKNFVFLVLPKSAKVILVEERILIRLDIEAKWEERCRLEAHVKR